MAEEKRLDSGWTCSYQECAAFYRGQYTKREIKDYWAKLPLAATGRGGKGRGKGKVKEAKQPKYRAKTADGDSKEQDAKATKVKFEDMEASGLCVAGEALIDFLPATTTDGASAYKGVPGGSPFNCCVAAQRLGLPVTFLGAVSTDLFGEELCGHLSKEGVNMDMVLRVKRPSTLAFVCKQAGEGEKYAFFKENSADSALGTGAVAKSMKSHRFRAVHMSLGAITLEHGPCSQAFRTLFQLAGRQQALRSFDPNIRANMIQEPASRYARRIERLLRLVDLAKTSQEDIEYLYGQEAGVGATAAKWLKGGPKLVVVTKGAEGAEAFFLREGEEAPVSVVVTPPGERPQTVDAGGKPVAAVDTVGAGDTFMGGLLTGCLGGESKETTNSGLLPQLLGGSAWDAAAEGLLKQVLQRAAVSAAICCARAGCDPPKTEEVASAMSALGLS